MVETDAIRVSDRGMYMYMHCPRSCTCIYMDIHAIIELMIIYIYSGSDSVQRDNAGSCGRVRDEYEFITIFC
jgi:hypothetical protein